MAVVVGGLQDGEEVVGLAVLREDTDAAERALLAGDVERGVPTEVPDIQVAASLQQVLGDFGLVRDDRQVERSLAEVVLEVQEGGVPSGLPDHLQAQGLFLVNDRQVEKTAPRKKKKGKRPT